MSRGAAVATPENARTAKQDRGPLGSRLKRRSANWRSTSLIPSAASRFLAIGSRHGSNAAPRDFMPVPMPSSSRTQRSSNCRRRSDSRKFDQGVPMVIRVNRRSPLRQGLAIALDMLATHASALSRSDAEAIVQWMSSHAVPPDGCRRRGCSAATSRAVSGASTRRPRSPAGAAQIDSFRLHLIVCCARPWQRGARVYDLRNLRSARRRSARRRCGAGPPPGPKIDGWTGMRCESSRPVIRAQRHVGRHVEHVGARQRAPGGPSLAAVERSARSSGRRRGDQVSVSAAVTDDNRVIVSAARIRCRSRRPSTQNDAVFEKKAARLVERIATHLFFVDPARGRSYRLGGHLQRATKDGPPHIGSVP